MKVKEVDVRVEMWIDWAHLKYEMEIRGENHKWTLGKQRWGIYISKQCFILKADWIICDLHMFNFIFRCAMSEFKVDLFKLFEQYFSYSLRYNVIFHDIYNIRASSTCCLNLLIARVS